MELEATGLESEAIAEWDEERGLVTSVSSNFDEAQILATVAGQEVVVASLPRTTEPNTPVTYNLTAVADALRTEALDDIGDSIDDSLNLDTQFAGLFNGLTAEVRDQVIVQLEEATQPLFDSLNDTLITGTLNVQNNLNDGVEAAALELTVLPGAGDCGVNAINVSLARSSAVAIPNVEDTPAPPVQPVTPDNPTTPDDSNRGDNGNPDDNSRGSNNNGRQSGDRNLPSFVDAGK